MNPDDMKRRDAMRFGAAAAVAGATALTSGCATSTAAPAAASGNRMPMNFKDPIWNRDTQARMDGDLDPAKQVLGWSNGVVLGVRDNEKVRPLFRYEVFSTNRMVRQPDGNFIRLNRELVFYRNIETGKLMDQWLNPYSGETVRVVDIANDPFNYRLTEFFPDPPSYGGLNAADRPPRRPFLLNWVKITDAVASVEIDIHLYYPSALRPEKWPRESPGPMSRVSEMFRYFVNIADLENPALTHVPYHGNWSRITPWLPWMLMDQGPGHCLYVGTIASRTSLDDYEPDVIARVKERYPRWLNAPTEWSEPSLSSLEHYAREQTPQPPRVKAKP